MWYTIYFWWTTARNPVGSQAEGIWTQSIGNYLDFEGAVQMISSVQSKMDCLVTRNIKAYQPLLLPVMQPADFLSTFS